MRTLCFLILVFLAGLVTAEAIPGKAVKARTPLDVCLSRGD